jgi:hypothetical protein
MWDEVPMDLYKRPLDAATKISSFEGSFDTTRQWWAFSDPAIISKEIGDSNYKRLVLDRAFYFLFVVNQEAKGVPTSLHKIPFISERVMTGGEDNVAGFIIACLLDWAKRADTEEFKQKRANLGNPFTWPSIQADFIKLAFRVLLGAGVRMYLGLSSYHHVPEYDDAFFNRADEKIEEGMKELKTLPFLGVNELLKKYPRRPLRPDQMYHAELEIT